MVSHIFFWMFSVGICGALLLDQQQDKMQIVTVEDVKVTGGSPLAQLENVKVVNTRIQVPSKLPGSRPPQCHNDCGLRCLNGRCIARPRYLQGGHNFGQHAVWTCACQTPV